MWNYIHVTLFKVFRISYKKNNSSHMTAFSNCMSMSFWSSKHIVSFVDYIAYKVNQGAHYSHQVSYQIMRPLCILGVWRCYCFFRRESIASDRQPLLFISGRKKHRNRVCLSERCRETEKKGHLYYMHYGIATSYTDSGYDRDSLLFTNATTAISHIYVRKYVILLRYCFEWLWKSRDQNETGISTTNTDTIKILQYFVYWRCLSWIKNELFPMGVFFWR